VRPARRTPTSGPPLPGISPGPALASLGGPLVQASAGFPEAPAPPPCSPSHQVPAASPPPRPPSPPPHSTPPPATPPPPPPPSPSRGSPQTPPTLPPQIIGGRLALHWRQWRNLGASPAICAWLRHGIPTPLSKAARLALHRRRSDHRLHLDGHGLSARHPSSAPSAPPADKAALWFHHTAVPHLLATRTIVPGKSSDPHARLILVPKSGDRQPHDLFRPCLALGHLRPFLPRRTFSHALSANLKQILPGDYAIVFDLQQAFLQLPSHSDFLQFQAFRDPVSGAPYRFNGIVMGCPISSWQLHRVLSAATAIIRRTVRTARYADDFVILHPDPTTLRHLASRVKALLARLGLLADGLDTAPSQHFDWLGLRFDTADSSGSPCPPRCRLTPKRLSSLTASLTPIISAPRLPARALAQALGRLIAARPAILRRHAASLLSALIASFSRPNLNWSQRIAIPDQLRQAVKPLVAQLPSINASGLPLRPPSGRPTIYTDASERGSGFVLVPAPGARPIVIANPAPSSNINAAETSALLRAARLAALHLPPGEIRIMSDSLVAAGFLRRGFSRPALRRLNAWQHKPDDLTLSRTIPEFWRLIENAGFTVRSIDYINTALNPADLPSRFFGAQQWTLTRSARRALLAQLPPSWPNPASTSYVEPFAHQGAPETLTWPRSRPCRDPLERLPQLLDGTDPLWLAPPYALIPDILDAIQSHPIRAPTLLILPDWATANFPSLLSPHAIRSLDLGPTRSATCPLRLRASAAVPPDNRSALPPRPQIETWLGSRQARMQAFLLRSPASPAPPHSASPPSLSTPRA